MVADIVTYLLKLSVSTTEKQSNWTDMQLQKMPKLAKFAVEVFINCVKPLLKLPFCQLANRVMGRIVIDVWE